MQKTKTTLPVPNIWKLKSADLDAYLTGIIEQKTARPDPSKTSTNGAEKIQIPTDKIDGFISELIGEHNSHRRPELLTRIEVLRDCSPAQAADILEQLQRINKISIDYYGQYYLTGSTPY